MTETCSERKESPVGFIIAIAGLAVILYLAQGNLERIVTEMKGYVFIVGLFAVGFQYGYNKLKK